MILSDYRIRLLSLVALACLLHSVDGIAGLKSRATDATGVANIRTDGVARNFSSAIRDVIPDGVAIRDVIRDGVARNFSSAIQDVIPDGVAIRDVIRDGVARNFSSAIQDAAKAKRLEWFREAKYGLFIHWGLYAAPAGQWKGKRIPGIGEWIMNRAQIPVKEYEQLARTFNPVKFNADEWVQLATDAGMKYIVITSKHHDGFALFDSKVSTWDIVDATPFKRDVLKELAAACARAGIRLGFYYSQSQDWHEKNGAGNTWDFGPDEQKDYDEYLLGKAEPQIKELLTGYGPIALIWFDTPRMMTGERPHRFTRIVRSMQPDTLIDGRLGVEGDYVTTGDNVVPSDVLGEAWEVPATLNHTWGYRSDDHDWKSPQTVIFKLIDIVSKGGNYLLNVGPTAEGVIPQPSQDVLRTVGRWLRVNGEAVYGAHATPFGDELGEASAKGAKSVRGEPLFLVNTQWRYTTKPGKLYVTFFDEPRAPFALPAIKNRITRAYHLDGGAEVKISVEGGRTFLNLDRPILNPTATVVVVEFEGDRVIK